LDAPAEPHNAQTTFTASYRLLCSAPYYNTQNLWRLTTHITGSKKQSEERAALFAVRVHVIVSLI